MANQDNAISQAMTFATQLEQVNDEVIATVASCSEDDWRVWCEDEGRSVRVLAHHIAAGYRAEQEGMETVLRGQPLPPIYQDREKLNQFNAQYALEHAECTQAETLALLRRDGAEMARFIRTLSAEDLQRSAPFPLAGDVVWTVQQWLESVVIPHPRGHLQSIRAALGRQDDVEGSEVRRHSTPAAASRAYMRGAGPHVGRGIGWGQHLMPTRSQI
jgi:hypothetical protein